MIVSPTLMIMAIQVIKQMRKDSEMREAADQIRAEVGHMMKDVGWLSERVRKLQTHFGQANKDIDDILTSTGRIEKRGEQDREASNSTATESAAPTSSRPGRAQDRGRRVIHALSFRGDSRRLRARNPYFRSEVMDSGLARFAHAPE